MAPVSGVKDTFRTPELEEFRMTCQKSLAPLPGCDHHGAFQTPGVASLHPGLISPQPSGLRSARRRRASKLARGESAKRATPGKVSISGAPQRGARSIKLFSLCCANSASSSGVLTVGRAVIDRAYSSDYSS